LTAAEREVGPERFREVLSAFATGVTVVTANDGGEMVGMSANSFTSVSLDPPLVAFCAAHTSATYPRLRQAGHFSVNVLAEDQADLAKLFSQRNVDRFESVAWRQARSGGTMLEGVLAWLHCAIDAEHEAGDHVIVVGRVLDLEVFADRRPLLFFRGAYGVERSTVPLGDSPPPLS
jgi:3-hydroxy-9,10-secoandrosta-1,3,5(10)-triene-9,17-dione monooxygenase reductase component